MSSDLNSFSSQTLPKSIVSDNFYESLSENLSTGSQSSESFFSRFHTISKTTWFIILFLLAFLGINLFKYMADGTDTITEFAKPIISAWAKLVAATGMDIVDVAGEGGKQVVDVARNVVDTTFTQIPNTPPDGLGEPGAPPPSSGPSSIPSTMPASFQSGGLSGSDISMYNNTNRINDENTINIVLDNAQAAQEKGYESSVMSFNGGGDKTRGEGWCYIGTDRGVRSCSQVGRGDTCMSGDIFPSQAICVNPTLRQ